MHRLGSARAWKDRGRDTGAVLVLRFRRRSRRASGASRRGQRHLGVSQGAFLGMRCALTHPEQVRALVLIATQTGIDDPATLQGYEKMLDAWIANKLPDQIAATFERILFGAGWPGAAPWKATWRAMIEPNIRAGFDALARRDDIGDKVSAIHVPTLIIHGDADNAIPLGK